MLYEENLRNRNRGEKKASWPRLWTFLWIRAHMEVYTANLQAVCNYSRVYQDAAQTKKGFFPSSRPYRIPSKRPGLGEEAAKAMYSTLVTSAIGHLSRQARQEQSRQSLSPEQFRIPEQTMAIGRIMHVYNVPLDYQQELIHDNSKSAWPGYQ